MASNQHEGGSVGRVILAGVAVGATLLPVLILVTYVRNLLAGDPPSLLWASLFGVCLIAGVLGSGLLGIYLWNGPIHRKRRQLTLSLVAVGVATVAAFTPVIFLVVP